MLISRACFISQNHARLVNNPSLQIMSHYQNGSKHLANLLLATSDTFSDLPGVFFTLMLLNDDYKYSPSRFSHTLTVGVYLLF